MLDVMLKRLVPLLVSVGAVLSVMVIAQEAPKAFPEWLADLRAEALARGLSARAVDAALTGVELLPVVLERDNSQPELKLTLQQYLDRRLTPRVIRTGREMARRHQVLLRRVSATYGVPAPTILAIWGLESNYGTFLGTRSTVSCLATLAFSPHRQALFREELFAALSIIDRGDIEPARLKGSWAGAMGQPQFMPSSYLKFAVDFDEDGRRDIWSSPADIFGSIANYLHEHGWVAETRWGRPVEINAATEDRVAAAAHLRGSDGCIALREMTGPLPYTDWKGLGVRAARGAALPSSAVRGSLLRVEGRSYLVTANYEAILAYNCAHAYGLSVALLSDRIAGG